MVEDKDDLVAHCMKYLGKTYKKESPVYKRVDHALRKLNNIELDSIRTMLISINVEPAGFGDETPKKLEKLLKPGRTKPLPLSYDDVANLKMTSGNEKKISKIILNGNVEEWVGIGWITLGKAKEEDYYLYPEVK